jgi:integrase
MPPALPTIDHKPMKEEWPKIIRSGSVTVKIYPSENNGYKRHIVTYYLGKRRMRKAVTDFAGAKKEAERIANRLSHGETQTLKLTSADSAAYVEAQRRLSSLNVPLLSAVEEYCEAKKLGVPLLAAARYYLARHSVAFPRKPIAEIVEEFIKAKAADGMSVRYLADLRSRLGRFSRDIHSDVASVDAAVIASWLRALGQSGRSRNNYRGAVQSLFRFARSNNYLPKNEPTAADDLPLAKDTGGEIGIFKVEDFAQLLIANPEELKVQGNRHFLVPYFVLGGLCGLRHAEINRMDWTDIDLSQRVIRITAAKAKTAANRIVPLCESAVLWLTEFKELGGQICSDRQSKYARDVARKLEIDWPSNGLRHSYGSYRLAEVKSAPQVALEMGNTPQMIFGHYRALVTEKDAEYWFKLSPENALKFAKIREAKLLAAA